jgi:glycosyltransferase involved in cell wall biosynthesis
MPDLSVLIAARNEMFLQNTIDDVAKNARGDTEIIVVLDGELPDDGIPSRKNLTIIQRPESIGQRAAVNEAARVSTARYIMKLDAHCSVGEGFDVVLLEAAKQLGDDVLQVPKQWNLHAFDWVCPSGHRRDQGPSDPCKTKIGIPPRKCGLAMKREIVWTRRRPTTTWYFNRQLRFGYWGMFQHRPEGRGDIAETMSLLGACWFTNRGHFWKLGGLDEGHGGWGQMGTELACMYWLSGGRVVCNKRTWFAHMFRTQGRDFGFPYRLSIAAQERARKYSREKWLNDYKWPKATRRLAWLIEHFAPVPDWEESCEKKSITIAGTKAKHEPIAPPAPDAASSAVPSAEPTRPERVIPPGSGSTTAAPTKGIVYYSDCRADEMILGAARKQLLRVANGNQIVSVTLAPVEFGDIRVVFAHRERGYLTMFRQILAGLEMSDADIVFLAEHDVLYHRTHFEFTPEDDTTYYYNENTWRVDATDGKALFYYAKQTSGLCAYRELLLQHYRARVERVARDGFTRKMGFEPGTHRRPRGVDDYPAERWMSRGPNVDIRHAHNLTASRWSQEEFRDPKSCLGWTEADRVPGWGVPKGRFQEFLKEVVP